jgi:hypothetical protein
MHLGLTDVRLPILRFRNDSGAPTIDMRDLEPIRQSGPLSVLKLVQQQLFPPKLVDRRSQALPRHDLGQTVAQVVGEPVRGIARFDVDERVIELAGRTPGHCYDTQPISAHVRYTSVLSCTRSSFCTH